jgi:hypothetical protein
MTVRRTVARPAHPHPDARASAQGRPEARRPSWATPAAKQLRITRAPHLHDAQELFSEQRLAAPASRCSSRLSEPAVLSFSLPRVWREGWARAMWPGSAVESS